MTLRFPNVEDTFDFFTCLKCESRTTDGTKVMDGVVMDGSAVGILRNLPRFERFTRLAEPATRSADKQYITRNEKSRILSTA